MYRPFRPRLARRASLALAIVLIIGTIVLFAVVPTEGSFSFSATDYVAAVFFLGFLLYLLYMQYQVHATVTAETITVKNLIYSHTYEWAQVLNIEFGGGPWARLDISDGTTVAVMAIQSADGAYARAEAVRLATLIEAHSSTGDRD